MRSAACGQAAEDLEFFVYRAVDVRRRWSWACLLVLFCRCVAPDHALCLVSVLSAYSLQASCVVFEALRVRLWVLLARRGDERVFVASSGSSSFVSGSGRALEVKTLGEPRALSRRHATSLFLSRSFWRIRRASGLVAALACAQSPRGDGRQEGVVFRH